jgi:hypothetical protein
VKIEPIDLDLPHAAGLTSTSARAGNPDLEQAWRIEPGHLGSGVLFMARLTREAGDVEDGAPASDGGWNPVPSPFSATEGAREPAARALEESLAELEQSMGVGADALESARWLIRGEGVWLHSCAEWPLDGWAAGEAEPDWRLLSVGVRAFRLESSGRMRATNDLMRRLDRDITERVVTLGREEMVRLLSAGELPAAGTSDGYVALRLEEDVVGRGFVRAGRLRSEIPRPQARLLVDTLTARAHGARAP